MLSWEGFDGMEILAGLYRNKPLPFYQLIKRATLNPVPHSGGRLVAKSFKVENVRNGPIESDNGVALKWKWKQRVRDKNKRPIVAADSSRENGLT